MAGFTANKKSVHGGSKATGFVRAGAGGARHRYKLPPAPKPAVAKNAPPPEASEGLDLGDSGMGMGMMGDMGKSAIPPPPEASEGLDLGDSGIGPGSKTGIHLNPHPHQTVTIHLSPSDHKAFKGMNSRRKK